MKGVAGILGTRWEITEPRGKQRWELYRTNRQLQPRQASGKSKSQQIITTGQRRGKGGIYIFSYDPLRGGSKRLEGLKANIVTAVYIRMWHTYYNANGNGRIIRETEKISYGGLDGPKGQKSMCVATTWLRQHEPHLRSQK